MENEKWSDGLIATTRKLVELEDLMLIPPMPQVFFKNIDGRYGYITVPDLVQRKLSLYNRRTNELLKTYTNTDALIDAGWALD